MKLPRGKSEAEVLDAIERAVSGLAPSYLFGCHDVDDIRQQARMFALEALPRYDPDRPLYNFLCKHVRNRLSNFKRDKHRRHDPPCRGCATGTPCEEGISVGGNCKKYAAWLERNNAKANLSRPLCMGGEHERGRESETHRDAEMAETLARIDEALPVELRADYLRMREGVSVPRARREVVTEAVREILGG